MKRKLYIIVFIFCFVQTTLLQVVSAQSAELKYRLQHSVDNSTQSFASNTDISNSTGQSGTGANYDVKYHKILWRINPDSAVIVATKPRGFIKGYVQTNFLTLGAPVSTMTMDIYSGLTVDSVRFRGAKLPAGNITRSGNIMTITLSATIPANTLDSIWVYYKGITPAVNGAAQGYQPTSTAGAGNILNTLSESYEDRDWWPCKADMQDKIDSMDISVNVPWGTPTAADTFWVAANGKLVDSTITGSSRTFRFVTHYPIASYLVSVSVAHYKRFYSAVNVNGTTTQAAYYLLSGYTPASTYTTITSVMDNVNNVLVAFGNKFGDYPYKREKHGFYDGLVGAGGMEHQTFSGIDPAAISDYGTLCHELMHQWFGDKVTFATWADLYLAEGFAQYGEALAGELVPSTGISPTSIRNSAKNAARSITTTPTRITSYANSIAVWSSNNVSAVYSRGCMVVSMLRALSGDNNFFTACKNYLDSANGSGYKSATTDSLKNNFNRVLNYDLTPFFNDFVIGVGHPTTLVNWNNPFGNRLAVSIGNQTRTAGATASYFHNVIVIRVQGSVPATQDTTIVIYDMDGNNLAKAGMSTGIGATTPGNLLTYDLSFKPVTVTFDPFFQTMSAGSTFKLTTLAVKVVDFFANKTNFGNETSLSVISTDPISKVELQRSTNATDFVTAGEMNLLNPGGQTLNYSFTDQPLFATTVFYRAKIYYAGKEEYTNIIKIQGTQVKTLTVSPNPADKEVKIAFDNAAGEEYKLRILSADGKLVKEIITNTSLTHFDTGDMAAGVYMLQVVQQGKVSQSSKFLVRH
jgi:hypothetical protein